MYHTLNTRTLEIMLRNEQKNLEVLKNHKYRLVAYEEIKKIATELSYRLTRDKDAT